MSEAEPAETYRITHPSTGDPLPPKPDYETDAEAAIDAALVDLFEAATEVDDDYYRGIAANELGTFRLSEGTRDRDAAALGVDQ